ncbi:MAG: hypothetical protein PHD51_01850 [Patescibacteria group bacterium]|nr:hypothetical protein [Patescibacteria group bacterium]MDD5490394.1 hypothetical protein [Patescibacteria group bacterium]
MNRENINSSPEQKKELRRYVYTDHKIEKVIFECEAGDILEADELYKKATGNDSSKQAYVGIQILEIKKE